MVGIAPPEPLVAKEDSGILEAAKGTEVLFLDLFLAGASRSKRRRQRAALQGWRFLIWRAPIGDRVIPSFTTQGFLRWAPCVRLKRSFVEWTADRGK